MNHNSHIVARCLWNTSFDDKEKGVELQNAISHWSEHHMPREINTIFDAVCPEKQTLKIKTLKLDLGVISYENLKEDLHLKLRTQLLLTLRDLLMYPDKHAQSIEILREENTYLHTLKYFLLQGVMPWDYQGIKGTVNQIIEHQLTHNRHEVMRMIKTVGIEEYVRRRIAWQLKETNVQQIIKNIERSNHNYIIDFSEEFIKIQQQETIVKTGIYDFKKNLMFWILNYLFVERGTMFNKVDFVRSNIQQMANHFNIEYNELFALIEDAVYKVHEHSYVKTNFILILSILSQKQSKPLQGSFANERQQEKQWQLLIHYFKSANNRSTTYQKKRFEELIHSLSETNPSRFKKLLDSVQNTATVWKLLSKDISVATLKILLHMLAPVKAQKILQQVALLQQLNLPKQFNLDKKWMLHTALEFLTHQKTAAYSEKRFLNYVVQQLSSFQKVSRTTILETIVAKEVVPTHKNTETAILVKNAEQLYTSEVLKELPSFTEERLLTLLKELEKGSFTVTTKLPANYYKVLQLWLTNAPKAVWDVLRSYENKNFIQELLFILLEEDKISKRLFKSVFPEYYSYVKQLQKSIDRVISEKAVTGSSLQTLKRRLLTEAITVALFNENIQATSFVKKLIEQLSIREELYRNSSKYQKELEIVLAYFFETHQEFSELQKTTFNLLTQSTSKIAVLIQYMQQSQNKQQEVGQLLTQMVHEKKTDSKTFQQNEKSISNYLLKEGYAVQKECIEAFVKKRTVFTRKLTALEIEKVVKESYWQCIADYNRYKGDKVKFKALLNKAISYCLGEMLPHGREKLNEEKNYEKLLKANDFTHLNANYSITTEALINAIKTGKSHIIIDHKTVTLKEIVYSLLEQTPQKVRELLQEIVEVQVQIDFLQSVISFQEFIMLIAKDKLNNSLHQFCDSVLVLVQLVKQIESKLWTKTIERTFWKHSVHILNHQNRTITELEQLSTIVLNELATIEEVTAFTIVEYLRENSIKIPQVLRGILIEKNTTFELLETKQTTKEVSGDLQVCVEKNKIKELCESLCLEHKIPSWYAHSNSITPQNLINEILQAYPLEIISVLRKNTISIYQLKRLVVFVEGRSFFEILQTLYPNQQAQFSALEKLYASLKHVSIRKISGQEIQQILLEKVVKAWIASNWKPVETSFIWKELLWELKVRKNVNEKNFLEAFETYKTALPISLQVSYNETKKGIVKAINKTLKLTNKPQENMSKESQESSVIGVSVPNAGLVLLNNYFLMLFERLELVKNNQFISEEARSEAIHYLQYVVTGLTQTDESLLALNKVLCGVPLSQPIKDSFQITEDNKVLIEGMLKSVINYWNAIGDTSISGFRGNWLVRNGVLKEEADRWSLLVEKRVYDILLTKCPFSFSIIKLPWMDKPLHITWPY